jgi:glycosyltransferase involved in cell wall biosynthesis
VIRVIILIDRYLPILGGAQNNVHELSSRLSKHGYKVTVLTRKLGKELSDGQQIGEISVKRFGSFPNRVISKIMCLLTMTGYLIRNRSEYDLVLCVPCAYYSDILPAFLSSFVTGKPYVIRTTMSGNMDYMLSIRSDSVRDYLKKIIFPPLLFRKVINMAEMVVTQSVVLYENSIPKYHLPHCELVLSGVDTSRFRRVSRQEKGGFRRKLDFPSGSLVAITTGRYVRGKNIMTFIKAIEQVNGSSGRRLHGIILGATEYNQFDSNEEELKGYVRERRLAEVIRFVDNAANVDEYLQASDIFIFPTIFDEGMSNSLLEAMACGLPIIASNIPQVTRTFPPGEWLFFDPLDVEELAGRITKLVDSEQSREELGQRIEEYARQKYSSLRVAEQYDQLLQKITNQQAAVES